jgi:hypothetical protein
MKISDFAYTDVSSEPTKPENQDIVDFIKGLHKHWSEDRQPIEEEWKACWAEYFSNSRGADTIRAEASKILGDVQTDWRHKIPTGKAFELVEDANSYLQGAFFPNRQWFDILPKQMIPDDDWVDVLKVIQKFIQVKLDEAYFSEWWDLNIRQCLITGTSVLALPWRYETTKSKKNVKITNSKGTESFVPKIVDKVIKNGLDICVLDMFDFFIDPLASDPKNANCIRRYTKTKGELVRLVENGTFNQEKVSTILNLERMSEDSSTYNKSEKVYFAGASSGQKEYCETDKVDVLEYWGNIVVAGRELIDVCATISGDTLLDLRPNPFWGGKPYVVTTFVRVHEHPYGLGLLAPVCGQLHQMFTTMNHRLDISELVVNPMWKMLNDGTIDLSSLFSAPAKIIPVESMENLQPITFNAQNLGITVEEENMLEQRIERVTGISAYVGQGGGRDAERVTAAEVNAKRNAGGNRLGRYHKHIEDTALRELLEKCYLFMQQFVVDDEIVRVTGASAGSTTGSYDFIKVGQEELQHEVDIIPVGSDWVVDKEREITERLDFIGLVSQNPIMSEMVNWEEVMKDLARRMIKQDWDKFINLGTQQAAPMPPELQNPATPPQQDIQPQLPPAPPELSIPVEQRLASEAPLEGKQAMMQMMGNPEVMNQLAQ